MMTDPIYMYMLQAWNNLMKNPICIYMYIYWNGNKCSDMANCSRTYSIQEQRLFSLRRADHPIIVIPSYNSGTQISTVTWRAVVLMSSDARNASATISS